ncbi:MAG TPA: hypothetical protein VE463_17780, partial [Blastococcus sp.]|nr:hypothetical protein [Blastococcus sp.]
MSHRRRPRDPIPGPGDSRGGSGHGTIATARGPERPEAGGRVALVGAGVLTVLVFPAAAVALGPPA